MLWNEDLSSIFSGGGRFWGVDALNLTGVSRSGEQAKPKVEGFGLLSLSIGKSDLLDYPVTTHELPF